MTALILISLTLTAGALAARQPSHAVRASNQIVQLWACQDQIGIERTPVKKSPWAIGHHGPGWKRAYLNKWVLARKACFEQRKEIKRQWNWQAWLPPHWKRVGTCETGLNWQHSNSSYQGAFGFAISSWDGFKNPGYPDEAWQATPWQQYQTALNIYNRYGMSGWGCKG